MAPKIPPNPNSIPFVSVLKTKTFNNFCRKGNVLIVKFLAIDDLSTFTV